MFWMPFGTPRNTWRRRISAVALSTAVAGSVLALGSSTAHPAPTPAPTVHIRVSAVGTCPTALVVAYSMETLTGRTWVPRQDDGKVALQLHYVGNGSGNGQWVTVSTVSGGENHLRLVSQQPTYDSVRVVWPVTGVTSSPRVPDACPAA